MQCMNLLWWINCYFKLNSINGLVISFIFGEWDWKMNEWYNRKYLCYVMKMIKCLWVGQGLDIVFSGKKIPVSNSYRMCIV